MKLRYYFNLVRGKTSALNPPKPDLRHIWAVIQSHIRSLIPPPKHIREQIIWRRGEVAMKSPKCWIEGKCIYCGCEILPKTKCDMACESEPLCYPPMMDKKTWEKFKKDRNIKLFC